jgi:hypothetical protein
MKNKFIIFNLGVIAIMIAGFLYANNGFSTFQQTDVVLDGDWKIYKNEQYFYQIEYPSSNLSLVSSSSSDVTFAESSGYWRENIRIINTGIKSLDEWLDQNPGQKIEQKIVIDGGDALVTYENPKSEIINLTDNSERATVFLRDDKIYTVSTRGIDYKRVLNSFKFYK